MGLKNEKIIHSIEIYEPNRTKFSFMGCKIKGLKLKVIKGITLPLLPKWLNKTLNNTDCTLSHTVRRNLEINMKIKALS